MTETIGSDWVVVDSSGWLEFITDDSKASLFDPYFLKPNRVVVPTIVLYEVYKRLLATAGEAAAEQFVSQALRCNVTSLSDRLAVAAAELSLRHNLAMADAIVYATARDMNAMLVTSDPHFQGLGGVALL